MKSLTCPLYFTTLVLLMQFQKQPFRGVLKKKFLENIQQSYRRTPMPKCDFNKVASQED